MCKGSFPFMLAFFVASLLQNATAQTCTGFELGLNKCLRATLGTMANTGTKSARL